MKTAKRVVALKVDNIPCYCSIGIHDEEKKMGQKLLIDVSLEVNLSNAIISDNIKDTLSYVDVYKSVQRICQSKPRSLIEVLANEIAETFLKHPHILRSKVLVRKPHIPFPEFQGDVSIEVEREKNSQ